jgi:hypothetical protein
MTENFYKPVIVKKEVDDEHYYYVGENETSEPVFFPSVTKILHEAMPMPIGLRMWLGEVGNEKADQKLNAAGARGTMLHQACEALLNGEIVEIKNFEKRDQKCLVSFMNWFADFQPQDIQIEQMVASTLGYAGTLDIRCKISPEFLVKHKIKPQRPETDRWIIDIKTSAAIYLEHKLQITGYEAADYEMTGNRANRAILHLNPKTKRGYTFDTDMTIGDKPITIDDFMTVFNMYKMLNGGVIPEPKIVDSYPEKLQILQLAKENAKD